jgi:hypothetical protein
LCRSRARPGFTVWKKTLGALDLELTPADLREINSSLSKIDVHGERLPEAALKMTGL